MSRIKNLIFSNKTSKGENDFRSEIREDIIAKRSIFLQPKQKIYGGEGNSGGDGIEKDWGWFSMFTVFLFYCLSCTWRWHVTYIIVLLSFCIYQSGIFLEYPNLRAILSGLVKLSRPL